MTTEYRGQSDVGRWCGVGRAAVSNWISRFPDDIPQPDVIIVNEGARDPIRGWLAERQQEWLDFADARRAEPTEAGRAAARRARKTAALIGEGVREGRIDPAEAVKLLAELIGKPEPGNRE